MQELIDVSKSLLLNTNQKDVKKLAKSLADWALLGDQYNEREGRFERSGLSISPFIDLMVLASSFDTARSENAYEFCSQ